MLNRLLTDLLLWVYWTVILAAALLLFPIVVLWVILEEI